MSTRTYCEIIIEYSYWNNRNTPNFIAISQASVICIRSMKNWNNNIINCFRMYWKMKHNGNPYDLQFIRFVMQFFVIITTKALWRSMCFVKKLLVIRLRTISNTRLALTIKGREGNSTLRATEPKFKWKQHYEIDLTSIDTIITSIQLWKIEALNSGWLVNVYAKYLNWLTYKTLKVVFFY